MCLEMLMSACMMLVAFPHTEYKMGGQTAGWRINAFLHAISLSDVMSDILHQVGAVRVRRMIARVCVSRLQWMCNPLAGFCSSTPAHPCCTIATGRCGDSCLPTPPTHSPLSRPLAVAAAAAAVQPQLQDLPAVQRRRAVRQRQAQEVQGARQEGHRPPQEAQAKGQGSSGRRRGGANEGEPDRR